MKLYMPILAFFFFCHSLTWRHKTNFQMKMPPFNPSFPTIPILIFVIVTSLFILALGISGIPITHEALATGRIYTFGIIFDDKTMIYRSSSPEGYWAMIGIYMIAVLGGDWSWNIQPDRRDHSVHKETCPAEESELQTPTLGRVFKIKSKRQANCNIRRKMINVENAAIYRQLLAGYEARHNQANMFYL